MHMVLLKITTRKFWTNFFGENNAGHKALEFFIKAEFIVAGHLLLNLSSFVLVTLIKVVSLV